MKALGNVRYTNIKGLPDYSDVKRSGFIVWQKQASSLLIIKYYIGIRWLISHRRKNEEASHEAEDGWEVLSPV